MPVLSIYVQEVPMRTTLSRLLSVALIALGANMAAALAAVAADTELKGDYKVVLHAPLQRVEVLVAEIGTANGKTEAKVKDAQQQLGPGRPAITKIEKAGDQVTITVRMLGNTERFRGTMTADGDVLGTITLRGQPMPGSLKKAKDPALQPLNQNPFQRPFIEAMQDQNAKTKVAKLAELIKANPHEPSVAPAYAIRIQTADDAGLDAKQVQADLDGWFALMKPFGEEMVVRAQSEALKVLKSSKDKYAALAKKIEADNTALELKVAIAAESELGEEGAEAKAKAASRLAAAAKRAGKADLAGKAETRAVTFELQAATEADKALGAGGDLETKARAASRLAVAATKAGKADIASEAQARAEKIDAQLDEEYHKKVPPFKPEQDVARKDKAKNGVVLLELFTGAQCPPCVAADVAFDGLIQSYKPSELITLQYHLHIPGPDPLTNGDTVARAEYYKDSLGGTPSTYFNGRPEAGGGGGMQNSKGKYDEYRAIIDPKLETTRDADIDLDVSRKGDVIKIVAAAKVRESKKADAGKGGCTTPDDAKKDNPHASNLKLRLALVEDQVRYVGGNRLRFHHHVVRAMPGGVAGVELKDGQGKTEVTVNLDDVRKGLETYLSDFVRDGGAFPNPLPPIELKNLSVVAFVQDDKSMNVLHAVHAGADGETK
jgi:hypothetical protein